MIFESPDPAPSNLPPSGRIVYDHVLPEKTAFDPNSPAFIDGITGRIITRAELRRDTLRLGQGIHELKPRNAGREGKEPVVLIFSPNTMDYPVQFLGVQAAGCIASLVNASYLTDELAHQIRDGTPFLIFIHPTLVEILESALTLLKAEGHDTAAIKVYSTSSEGISSDKADKHHYPSYQTLYARSTSGVAVGYGRSEMSAQEIDDTPAVLCYSSGTVSLLHASCHMQHDPYHMTIPPALFRTRARLLTHDPPFDASFRSQTGRSKGVVTTNKNFNYLSALWSAHVNGHKVSPDKDKYVSVLPFYRESSAAVVARERAHRGVEEN